MSLDAIINTGASSAGKANVDSNYNLLVTLPSVAAQAGYARVAGRDNEALKVTSTGYICVSTENLEFYDTIDGTAVNTNLWNQSSSTMTITQASGFMNLNPTNSTTANAYAIVSTIQNFFVTGTNPLYVRLSLQSSLMNLPANTVMEFGWGTVATNAAPSDGVFVRIQNGSAYLVLNNGGTETTQAFALPSANATSEYWFNIYGSRCKLYIDNVLTVDLASPSSLAAITNNNRQPIFFRVYNSASSPGSSPTLKLGQISVQNINAEFVKPWNYKMAGMARSAVQNPLTTFAQLPNWTNSTEPASATLSNTAAGYTTLGGQYAFAAPGGAATDFALFGFQVPAGFQLYLTDVAISAMNGAINGGAAGATVATTPTVLQWGLAVNSSAVSLATADGAGTWAPRRLALGMQGFAVGAVVGTVAADIVRAFNTPLVCEGGRYVHVIVRIPTGTATANQIIRGGVQLNGYFE